MSTDHLELRSEIESRINRAERVRSATRRSCAPGICTGWAAISLLSSERSCLSARHLGRQRLERARDAQARGVLAAAEPPRDRVVGKPMHDPQLQRTPLLGRQRAYGVAEQRRQGADLAALEHPLVVLALGRRDRQSHAGAGRGLDAVVLVVLAEQVAGDAEQPWRAGAV